MSDMTIEEFCDGYGACDEGLEWARTHCTTMQECWEKLEDPGWLAWVASRPGVLTDNEKWKFGLVCCELVKTHLTDFRSFAAISILRLWLTNEVGLQELKLASWGAAAAWDDAAAAEEEEDLATATVAVAVNVDEDASSAGVPTLVDVVDYAYRAGADPARLMDWLRTCTKPNFTKKGG